MINVLVTGAGGGVGQGIIKSLKLINDLKISIITADMSELAAGLYGGDYSYIVPAANHPNYFDRIKEICINENISFYFPGTDVELIQCANNYESLKNSLGVTTFVSPFNVIEIADDKYKTIKFLEENGFNFPKTFLPHQIDLESLEFPLIIKPKIGYRSIGVHLVKNIQEALSAINSLKDPIIQEYIDGPEYTCTIAIFGDNQSEVLCLQRDLRAGDTFKAFPFKSEKIENYVRDIALKIGIQGSCNFQLRTNSVGEPYLFEINSRFSGTTPFCSYLGFNPVEFCLKSALNLQYSSEIDYEKIVLRHWTEVLVSKQNINDLRNNLNGKIIAKNVSSLL
ncbi:ATP-grasp domain-containing protein [Acinetobacter lwoffii]|uniref:ATP-grasp domain-containing protein n=1 Tax=Acinetobacter lwoffii TaxID=28090 RepID=UPI001C21829F|nr:ATP-grasp domain-containing protein [Acinetobacter lwoffii]QXB86682.1 ATP-grasp domain-containing protein [Acinetobacter lwoffii]